MTILLTFFRRLRSCAKSFRCGAISSKTDSTILENRGKFTEFSRKLSGTSIEQSTTPNFEPLLMSSIDLFSEIGFWYLTNCYNMSKNHQLKIHGFVFVIFDWTEFENSNVGSASESTSERCVPDSFACSLEDILCLMKQSCVFTQLSFYVESFWHIFHQREWIELTGVNTN